MAAIDVRRIQVAMAQAGMNYSQLSDKTGLSTAHISMITKRGTCNPATAGKIAKALEIPFGELIV